MPISATPERAALAPALEGASLDINNDVSAFIHILVCQKLCEWLNRRWILPGLLRAGAWVSLLPGAFVDYV